MIAHPTVIPAPPCSHCVAPTPFPPAGALLSSGDRLTADTISKVGQALAAVTAGAGEDEDLRRAAAAATGAYAKHCSPEELRGALEAGPLAGANGKLPERIGAAQASGGRCLHAAVA